MDMEDQGMNLKEKIAGRFKEFRTKGMEARQEDFDEFLERVNIPKERFDAYEKGEIFPDFQDLEKICDECNLNLNWVIRGEGKMFNSREKDMEELLEHIEENGNDHCDHYKMLLKSMQVPEMENLIFQTHGVVVNFVATLYKQLSTGPVFEKTHKMVEDVCY